MLHKVSPVNDSKVSKIWKSPVIRVWEDGAETNESLQETRRHFLACNPVIILGRVGTKLGHFPLYRELLRPKKLD